jgi:hypothetical protein
MPSSDKPIRGTNTHKVPKVIVSAFSPFPAPTEAVTSISTSKSAAGNQSSYTNQIRENMPKVDKDPIDVLFDRVPTQVLAKKEDNTPPVEDLSRLLPIRNINLSSAETESVGIFIEARSVLGPSSAVAMVCQTDCPIRHKCPLFNAVPNKAPFGSLCPFEAAYTADRFGAWMKEFGVSGLTMTETERIVISSLVVLDIQELRLLSIMAQTSRASMTSRVVRDSDVETHTAIAYEDVIAPEAQLRRDLHEQRIKILNDFNLTPAAKAKAMKAMSLRRGSDLANRQSADADLIRQANTITVEAEVVES